MKNKTAGFKTSRLFASLIFIGCIAAASTYVYIIYLSPQLVGVRVCIPRSPASALLILAKTRGYFRAEGLNAKISIQTSGRQCIESLIARQTDLAQSNIGPVVSAITLANPLFIISELQSSGHYMAMVFHKGKNGKKNFLGDKIAMVRGSDAELLLQLFVKAHADVTYANIWVVKTNSVEDSEDLLEKQKVQGAILWEPYLSEFLKANAEIYETEQSPLYTEFGLLVGSRDWATARPDAVERIVRALLRAQTYYDEKTQGARAAVLRYLNLPSAEVNSPLWSKFSLGLGLSSVLVSMMRQDERALLMQDETPAETSQINFLQSFYPQALRKINQDLVTYE